MITIYLDKQVFSHLFNAREEKYSLLRDKILSHKDEFIFFYSNAHLFDLQDDKTDIKYAEMEFMQSIVDGNRLIYEFPRQEVMKQSPREKSNFAPQKKIIPSVTFTNFAFAVGLCTTHKILYFFTK